MCEFPHTQKHGGSQFAVNVSNQKSHATTNQLISRSKINPISGGIPISTILPQRTNNSELTSYQSEKKIRAMNTTGNQQMGHGQGKSGKGNGGRQQHQFVIEEEGNQSQKSSEEDMSNSIGRSAGATSKGAAINVAKSFKMPHQM